MIDHAVTMACEASIFVEELGLKWVASVTMEGGDRSSVTEADAMAAAAAAAWESSSATAPASVTEMT